MEIVRRLTPREAERLQGYPDGWTLIGEPREVTCKGNEIKYELKEAENGELELIEVEKIPTEHKEIKYYYKDADGKEHECTDSARYKALGNSIALPQWWWLVNKMKPFLRDGATLGSLFDGIAGFPLVWESTYGEGTARWASEIEEFPISVTSVHFKEKNDG